MELTNIYTLAPEVIDRLLHSGYLTTCYSHDGALVVCDFSYENGVYIMRMKGGHSMETAARDFVQIVLNMCMGSATYTDKQEAHTETLRAIRPEICQ